MIFAFYQKLRILTDSLLQKPKWSWSHITIKWEYSYSINNTYHFKEGYEKIVFELSISNKKWLLLGNYKQPLPNDLHFLKSDKTGIKQL